MRNIACSLSLSLIFLFQPPFRPKTTRTVPFNNIYVRGMAALLKQLQERAEWLSTFKSISGNSEEFAESLRRSKDDIEQLIAHAGALQFAEATAAVKIIGGLPFTWQENRALSNLAGAAVAGKVQPKADQKKQECLTWHNYPWEASWSVIMDESCPWARTSRLCIYVYIYI